MHRIDDLRRWAATRAAGTGKLLLDADAYMVDLGGAVEAREATLAAQFAWHLARVLLSVADMARGGGVDVHSAAIERAGDDLLERAFDLATAPLADEWDPDHWLSRMRGLVGEVEELLGLTTPLPSLRDPERMFAGLAIAREWIELCARLGVPLSAVALQV